MVFTIKCLDFGRFVLGESYLVDREFYDLAENQTDKAGILYSIAFVAIVPIQSRTQKSTAIAPPALLARLDVAIHAASDLTEHVPFVFGPFLKPLLISRACHGPAAIL
jgi:hypothetical protein